MRRRTPAREVALTGTAVRTHGGPATITLGPGEAGFVFRRADLGLDLPADLDHLVPVPNCTALGAGGQPQVLFVEHVLSALAGLGYSDAQVTVHGPEIPLLDGSAAPLVAALQTAGAVELPGEVAPIVLDQPVWWVSEGQCVGALPADRWSVDYTFRHAHPLIRDDYLRVDGATDYATAIAPARTFATEHEIHALRDQGLIKGGSEDNLLIVYDDRFSAPLRLQHELAAHKLLDLIGDLALLGRPLQAQLVAYRTGHSDNHMLARAIRDRLAG